MKIAISATGPSPDAEVDPHFGRCQYFIVLDPQTLEFEAVEHASIAATRGAGITTAQMLASSGAQVVLTGECGSNAYHRLAEAGIQLITGVSGKIRDAIEAYEAGRLEPASEPTIGIHPSLGVGRGSEAKPAPEQELEALKAQSQMLAQQLREIERRVEELEAKDSSEANEARGE